MIRTRWIALLSAAWVVSFQISAAHADRCVTDRVSRLSGSASSALHAKASYKTTGYFTKATDEMQAELGQYFKSAGEIKKVEGKVRRVTSRDLAVDFNKLNPRATEQVLRLGREGLSKLYYFTSGAGLWSRGGGQVKALIPFNIKSLLSAEDFKLLAESGDIAAASESAEVLQKAGRILRLDENIDVVAGQILAERREILRKLIDKARASPDAMTPIDMKLATAALQSERAGTYIPFDIWTSEQTHEPIRLFLESFRKDFRTKNFHPDPAVDRRVKEALGSYLRRSDELGETHLFGYQVGYHALDPATGHAVAGTAPIGEGAGMAMRYLRESGRLARLQGMGKDVMVFENIEVLTDLSLGMGGHRLAGSPVSVILVPQKKGYKGGSPFLVDRAGQANLELHEMSALPKELAEGNEYFNSNTIFQSMSLDAPTNRGFEVKSAGDREIVRVKMNAGDVTLGNRTRGIGGRIGHEYENFKNYLEFGANGDRLIDTFRDIWARDTR